MIPEETCDNGIRASLKSSMYLISSFVRTVNRQQDWMLSVNVVERNDELSWLWVRGN